MTVPNSHEQVYKRPHILLFGIHLFCIRTVWVQQPIKKVLSYCWEIISSWETNCYFSRSTIARAIFVLRRLCPTQDLIYTQVPTDCFLFWFSCKQFHMLLCSSLLLCSFYFSVLIYLTIYILYMEHFSFMKFKRGKKEERSCKLSASTLFDNPFLTLLFYF